ncbi:unnamed protein product [Sphagnum jensenii]|uniref:DUF5681 domain-containing protein n=1 Tax=Sphagnum jensenii TaxID=128206 RepID=A0ABP0VL34_9BRYO
MGFKPGQSGNPLGRAKKPIDPRSEIMQEICQENREDLKTIGKSIIDSALRGEVWAIKESAKLFFPTPGTFVSVTKEEKSEVKILAAHFVQSLTEDERRTFMQLYLKAQKSYNPMAMMEPKSG